MNAHHLEMTKKSRRSTLKIVYTAQYGEGSDFFDFSAKKRKKRKNN